MMDANAFFRRMLLVAAVSALSMVNVAYAHGGHGSGGSSGGGSGGGGSAGSGSSSGGGHSASSTSGGHSATSTTSGHSATASKGTHSKPDPVSISNSTMANATSQHIRVYRIFQQVPSTGYTTKYRETNDEEWRRKHQRLFLGFIRY